MSAYTESLLRAGGPTRLSYLGRKVRFSYKWDSFWQPPDELNQHKFRTPAILQMVEIVDRLQNPPHA